MIARHSLMQSGDGEGVEVVENKECFDEKYGKGQFTEKRIHLSRFLELFCLYCYFMIRQFLLQSFTILDTIIYTKGFLCNREVLELLSIHNN